MSVVVDPSRWWVALAWLAAYASMCAAVWLRHRAQEVARRLQQQQLADAGAQGGRVVVAYGSQTGQAEQLAWRTAEGLHRAGRGVRVCALNDLVPETLRHVDELYVVTSTYGEGDAPDSAALFADSMARPGACALPHLRHAVLALGDRRYEAYCGFGQQVDAWLQAQGSQALGERVEVDQMDEAAIQSWFELVSRHAGVEIAPAAPTDQDRMVPWQLVERRHLNPGSPGEAVYHLEFLPCAGGLPSWCAGDLVEIAPPADARSDTGAPDERPRVYSISSVPQDGRLHLLVRVRRLPDGRSGTVSNWLCRTAQAGETVMMRLRSHPAFHIGANDGRRLVLVGNGTGMAGLRAHLRARAHGDRARAQPAWLFFGERDPRVDLHHAEELLAWGQQGVLNGLDLAFSRDPVSPAYVQDCLRARAPELRQWVESGAAIYVCGSLTGMASGVEEALREVLGADALLSLQRDGRYRRDVY